MKSFKVGDIYEDCSFHPCLCVGVDDQGVICGISLIDGSFPRSCDIESCSVRKLTLEEALTWKNKGPQQLDRPWTPLPDKQWWWPKPVEGINPVGALEHLFESSLNFLRNNMRATLGDNIVGWYSAAGSFKDSSPGSFAEATYAIEGSCASGVVRVEAVKEGRLWPIQSISVSLKGNDAKFTFQGEEFVGVDERDDFGVKRNAQSGLRVTSWCAAAQPVTTSLDHRERGWLIRYSEQK